VYVEDNCDAIERALHAPAEKVVGEVFNVGSGERRDVRSIAEDVCRLMQVDPEGMTVLIGDRPGQVMRHTACIDKIREVLGWAPTTGWEEGLVKTITWYRENRPWWEKQSWMREIPIITASGKRELH
jgi:dTDP-glucose 4,6-dehydratase